MDRLTCLARSALALGIGASLAAVAPQSLAQDREGAQLEEIIVTARFREESLQTTPIAITAVSGENLAAMGFTNGSEIGRAVPNAFFRQGTSPYGKSNQVFIRGVGQADFQFTQEPRTATYVDDVYFASVFGSIFDLMDLQQVEVLRGPQGTLFGRNAMGGAIRYVSRKPEGGDTGRVEATFGDYDRTDLRASYDVTLVEDKLFLRLAGASKHRDGYQTQLDFTCDMIARGTPELAGIGDGVVGWNADPDGPFGPLTGSPIMGVVGSAEDNAFSLPSRRRGGGQITQDCALGKFGGEDVQAARAMLRWTPTDKLDVLFTLHHSDDNSPVTAMQLAGVGDGVSENIPGTTIGLAPALQVFNDNVIGPAYGIQYDARFSTSDPFTTYATYDEVLFGENYPPVSTALTQGWSLSVDYDINDDLALKVIVADHDSDGQFSHDQDESPLPLYTVWNTVYSKETSYEVRLSGRAWNDRLDWTAGAFQWEADQHNGGQVSLRYYLLPFLVFPTTDYNFADNSGFYLHGVFALTDRLSLTTGWRTSDDDKRFEFSHFFDATVFTGGESEDWKIGLDYQINDTNMVYIQAATGYTASTFNGRPFTPDQLIGQPAEELEAYEIGYKTDFESARFSATYFYSDYATRVAGTGTLVDPVTMLPSTVAIAGPADINGLELEVSGTIGDNWIYNFNYGVLDYSAPEIGGGTPDPSTTCGFSTCIAADDGPEPPGQPRSNASAGLSYVGVLPNGGTITPRLDVFWTDTVQGLFSDSIIDAYSLTNFRVTYQTPDQDWSVSMALSNATDEFYVLNNFDLRGFGNPTFERQFGRPREWSLSFRHDF